VQGCTGKGTEMATLAARGGAVFGGSSSSKRRAEDDGSGWEGTDVASCAGGALCRWLIFV
jgi:hypothetical protein